MLALPPYARALLSSASPWASRWAAACHDVKSWQQPHFDHDKTGFALTNKHHQLVFRYDRESMANATGVDYIARYPVFVAWRVGPRILLER
jgi:hypothetical protein